MGAEGADEFADRFYRDAPHASLSHHNMKMWCRAPWLVFADRCSLFQHTFNLPGTAKKLEYVPRKALALANI